MVCVVWHETCLASLWSGTAYDKFIPVCETTKRKKGSWTGTRAVLLVLSYNQSSESFSPFSPTSLEKKRRERETAERVTNSQEPNGSGPPHPGASGTSLAVLYRSSLRSMNHSFQPHRSSPCPLSCCFLCSVLLTASFAGTLPCCLREHSWAGELSTSTSIFNFTTLSMRLSPCRT